MDGGPLFSVGCLNAYCNFSSVVLYGGWVGAGPTRLAAEGRGGCAFRLMWDGPRGEWRCFLRLLAPAGECPPRPYPPERSDSLSGLGALGVDGGGGVAEWAEAIPALEAPE